MKILVVSHLFFLVIIAGCSNKTPSAPIGDKIIRTGIDSATVTTDAARSVSEQTGIFIEGIVVTSSGAIKEIIISLEKLRRKSIQTFGQTETHREIIGPILLRCPYCKRVIQIKKTHSKEQRETCSHCSEEMIVRWTD